MSNPVLSILVITYNQRDLFKRCLNSVLGQKLNVPFEVIVSDDRSDDGTAEYMAALIQQWKDGKLCIQNLVDIVYTRCNSDDCNPKNVSERCGWNKLNAYRHARGKCFVNVDADDYLRSDDIYQLQLDMLETHPECSMCMQDVWQVNDGAPLESGFRWPSYGKLTNEQILSPLDIISDYRALNPCYMIRRHLEFDCVALYGKYFDDTIITQHHLQFGPVVYVNRADYVWIRYSDSIAMTLKDDDDDVEYGLLPLHEIRLIPAFAPIFMQAGLWPMIRMMKRIARNGYKWQLTERTQLAFREAPGYIYRVFSTNTCTLCDKIKLRYIRYVLLLYSHMHLTNWKYLYGLLIDCESARRINWKL